MKCCTSNPYKSNLCRKCWREYKESLYHCTWPNCIRPVFALTLCRNHYRQINVECAWPLCHRPSYCKQVCAHHYRKKDFPPKIECSQPECIRPMYMHGKCFYHFTCRTCTECNKPVFSKQLCQRHYMRQYRNHRFTNIGPTINKERSPAADNAVPEIINHSALSQSSLEHSVI